MNARALLARYDWIERVFTFPGSKYVEEAAREGRADRDGNSEFGDDMTEGGQPSSFSARSHLPPTWGSPAGKARRDILAGRSMAAPCRTGPIRVGSSGKAGDLQLQRRTGPAAAT